MSVVLDASIALAWVLREDHHELAHAAIAEGAATALAAPELFWLEAANILSLQLRRGRLSRADRDGALSDLDELAIEMHRSADRLAEIVALCDEHRLTAYDAAYLELALRTGAALATLDARLAAAARAEGLEVRTP